MPRLCGRGGDCECVCRGGGSETLCFSAATGEAKHLHSFSVDCLVSRQWLQQHSFVHCESVSNESGAALLGHLQA